MVWPARTAVRLCYVRFSVKVVGRCGLFTCYTEQARPECIVAVCFT